MRDFAFAQSCDTCFKEVASRKIIRGSKLNARHMTTDADVRPNIRAEQKISVPNTADPITLPAASRQISGVSSSKMAYETPSPPADIIAAKIIETSIYAEADPITVTHFCRFRKTDAACKKG